MINKSSYNLSFIVRASKVNKAGKAPIEVLISLGDERVVFSTGKLVALESWNKDKQCVRGVNSEAVALNEFIKNMRVRIYEEEIKLVKHGLDLLEKFINVTYNRDDVFLRELNRDFIEEFRIWLLTEHHLTHNGAVKYLALLKKVVNRAVANNKMSFNPFADYRVERQIVSPDFLTEDELRKIINFNSPLPRLERTRDMFLFACYTGLSYIDVKTLKAEHLERDNQGRMWIKKNRVKTGVLSRIPLLPSAKILLDKYAGNETLMPIYSSQDINVYLKDIAILCHIDKRITFHTARHTFASTVTLANNVSLIVVSKMLGHSNVRMTEHYAKLVDNCIGEEMDKLMKTYDDK